MRILHTSDWHLGRSLHQEDLHQYQRDFLEQIHTIVDQEGIDLVLVAGDVFDRAVPPVESVTLFADVLRRLADRCTVIVTSGNHDSAIRLGYGSQLFREGVHLVTDLSAIGTGIDVAAGDVSVRVYPIPYLVPDHAREVLKPTDEPLPRSHQAVVSAATDRIRADLASTLDRPTASIVMTPAFVIGGSVSESERDISVGGIDYVTADVFAGFDYVALGHLHGPQAVAAGEGSAIRYCGSPLRYSFSEASQNKSVTIVDVDSTGISAVTTVDITQPRSMALLTGTLDEVLSREVQQKHAESWVQVVVTDDARPVNLVSEVREGFPHALSIHHRPANEPKLRTDDGGSVAALDPVEISLRFIRDVANRDASNSEAKEIREVYEVARAEVEK